MASSSSLTTAWPMQKAKRTHKQMRRGVVTRLLCLSFVGFVLTDVSTASCLRVVLCGCSCLRVGAVKKKKPQDADGDDDGNADAGAEKKLTTAQVRAKERERDLAAKEKMAEAMAAIAAAHTREKAADTMPPPTKPVFTTAFATNNDFLKTVCKMTDEDIAKINAQYPSPDDLAFVVVEDLKKLGVSDNAARRFEYHRRRYD